MRVGQKFSHCAFLKASRARVAAAKAGHAPPRAKDSEKKEDGGLDTVVKTLHVAHQWKKNAREAAERRASRAAATTRTKRSERDPAKKVRAWRSEFAAGEKSGVDRLEALLRPPEE